MQRQIRAISRQLLLRQKSDSMSPVQLQLFDASLNKLVEQVNEVLIKEQTTRRLSREEQQYYKEMISNISHDFRTPLTAVKGYQQLLLKDSLQEQQREKVRIAQSHVFNLERLLETFFEYSYLLSQRDEPVYAPVRFDVLVEEYVAGLYTQFENKGIAIEVIAGDSQLVLMSDEGMLRRIIQNLLQNALQHSSYYVRVRFWQDETFCYVSVENRVDDLEAFSPEQLFERFYTKDKTRRKSSGLGLSIVRLLSERLGGSAVSTFRGSNLVFIVKVLNEQKPAISV
ncbi:MAG: HAMP domain-containing sensor histidine kinase [Lysinibacillus sp.]